MARWVFCSGFHQADIETSFQAVVLQSFQVVGRINFFVAE